MTELFLQTFVQRMYCYEVDKDDLKEEVATLRSEYGFRRDVATLIVCMSEDYEIDESQSFITEVLAAMGITPSGKPISPDDVEDLFAFAKKGTEGKAHK